jgi:hypothetical protein
MSCRQLDAQAKIDDNKADSMVNGELDDETISIPPSAIESQHMEDFNLDEDS